MLGVTIGQDEIVVIGGDIPEAKADEAAEFRGLGLFGVVVLGAGLGQKSFAVGEWFEGRRGLGATRKTTEPFEVSAAGEGFFSLPFRGGMEGEAERGRTPTLGAKGFEHVLPAQALGEKSCQEMEKILLWHPVGHRKRMGEGVEGTSKKKPGKIRARARDGRRGNAVFTISQFANLLILE